MHSRSLLPLLLVVVTIALGALALLLEGTGVEERAPLRSAERSETPRPSTDPGAPVARDAVSFEPDAANLAPPVPEGARAEAPEPSSAPAIGRVTGLVVSSDGELLRDARVEWADPRHGTALEPALVVATDADGRFSLEVAADAVGPIVARAEGFVSTTTWDVAAGDDVICVLERGLELQGIVLDAETELPVVGALVVTCEGLSSELARGDAIGRFTFAGLEAGTVDLVALALGYEPGVLEGLVVGGERTLPVELRLDPGPAVGGFVRDADTGAPVPEALVTYRLGAVGATRVLPEGAELPEATCRSAATGSFRFARLGVREAGLSVEAEGYAPASLEGPRLLENPGALEVRLVRGATVRGVVLDPRGQPVPFADVWQARGSEPPRKTDLRGSFEWTELDPVSRIQLVAHRTGFAPASTEPFRVADADEPIVLRLGRCGSIRGSVVGADGASRPGARVRLAGQPWIGPPAPEPSTLAVADESGRFAFTELTPGEYLLTSRGEESATEPLRVLLGPGESREVVLSVVSALTVSGRVFDVDLRPLAGVKVQAVERAGAREASAGSASALRGGSGERRRGRGLYRASGTPRPVYRTGAYSDADGGFELSGFSAATTVRLDFHRSGFAVESVEVEAGTRGVSVCLSALVTVEGCVLDASTGEPIREFSVELERIDDEPATADVGLSTTRRGGARPEGSSAFRDPDGAFVLDRLLSGGHRIRARAPGFRDGEWREVRTDSASDPGSRVELLLTPD